MNGYVWGGAVAGLLVTAAFGVWLAKETPRIRRELEGPLGTGATRALVVGGWIAYAYGALKALATAFTLHEGFHGEAGLAPAVAFGSGAVFQSLLPFLGAVVPALHIVALMTVAVVLYRHLQREAP